MADIVGATGAACQTASGDGGAAQDKSAVPAGSGWPEGDDKAAVRQQLNKLNQEVDTLAAEVKEVFHALLGDREDELLKMRYADLKAKEERLDKMRQDLQAQLTGGNGGGSGTGGGPDTTVAFLRPILPLRVAPSLEQLQSQCQTGVTGPDSTRVLLPVIPHAYDALVQQSTDWMEWVQPLAPGPGPWRLALHVSNILLQRVSQPGAELAMPALLDGMIYGTMQLLAELLGGVSLKRYRNQSEPSLTRSSLRPDLWVMAGGKMLFKAEDKTLGTQMPAARHDLLNKMSDWDFHFHPSCAAALMYSIWCTSSIHDISCCSLGLRHTACYMPLPMQAELLPSVPIMIGQKLERPFGTTITLLGKAVLKHVNLDQNPFLDKIHGRMSRVYQAQSKCLVAAETGYPRLTGRVYAVHLKPMGQALTLATVPLHLLHVAVGCILEALHVLHQAGFAHGDLRWENIVWVTDTQFVLIDLECSVALNDLREQEELLGCGVRPWAWGNDLDVLVSGCFTEASDLRMLGSMLKEIHARQPAVVCQQVMEGLLQKQWVGVQEVQAVVASCWQRALI